MTMTRAVRGLGTAALFAAVGCNTLDISNPNDPDKTRALADPNAIEALASGSIRTWVNAFTGLNSAGVLSTQARTFSSSWNNGNLNFYSGIDNSTASPDQWNRQSRTWQNDPAAGARTSLDAFWGGTIDQNGISRGGFYSALSAANDGLTAIRKNGIVINSASDTKRLETISVFMQGASLMMIALQYDKGYIVDENTDLTKLAYSNRKVLRDSAVSKLQQAVALAAGNTFTTPAAWTNGNSYTNVQIAQIANTLAAMTLAYYPRDASELAAVNWGQVASFASKGMSSGKRVDFLYVQDGGNAWISELMGWFDEIDGGRLSTRVSHFLDPNSQQDPYPSTGNPQPNSADKRMGDGSFGNTDDIGSFGSVPKTAVGGTDFAWLRKGNIFRPDRGFYHQSNIGYVRYDLSGIQDPNGLYGSFGPAPAIMSDENDLLWAEALLRQSAVNAPQAVALIDNSRVGRGGLPSSAINAGIGSSADGPCMSTGVKAIDGTPCTLWSMLLYEKEVELLGQGPIPFWEQRRLPVTVGGGFTGDNSPRRVIQGLLPGTPREMPVPYKELGVKGEALYTWGGATPNSPPVP